MSQGTAPSRRRLRVAVRNGDVAAVEAFFALPGGVEDARQAESFLAAQPRSQLVMGDPTAMTSRLRRVSGDAWFATSDSLSFTFQFSTREAAFSIADWLYGTASSLAQSTPVTLAFIFHALLFRAVGVDDVHTVELLLNCSVFQESFTDEERQRVLDEAAERVLSDACEAVKLVVTHGGAGILLLCKPATD